MTFHFQFLDVESCRFVYKQRNVKLQMNDAQWQLQVSTAGENGSNIKTIFVDFIENSFISFFSIIIFLSLWLGSYVWANFITFSRALKRVLEENIDVVIDRYFLSLFLKHFFLTIRQDEHNTNSLYTSLRRTVLSLYHWINSSNFCVRFCFHLWQRKKTFK